MRKTLGAVALMLALCGPAFAGEIPCPLNPAPPSLTAEEQATDGEMPNGEPDGLTETVLSVLGSVLALL